MRYPNQETKGIPPKLYGQAYLSDEELKAAYLYSPALPVAISSHSKLPGEIAASVGRALESAGVEVLHLRTVRNPLIRMEEFLGLTPETINELACETAGPTCQRAGVAREGDKSIRRALRFWQQPPLHLEQYANKLGEEITLLLRSE
jgi:hypothetical protein